MTERMFRNLHPGEQLVVARRTALRTIQSHGLVPQPDLLSAVADDQARYGNDVTKDQSQAGGGNG